MAYITSEEVKVIRNELKAMFPASEGWKISVRKEHHTTCYVTVLEAPYQMIEEGTHSHTFINAHNAKADDKISERACEDVKKMLEIINKTNYDNSDSMTDYFDVGFFSRLQIGNWEKGFKLSAKAPKAETVIDEVVEPVVETAEVVENTEEAYTRSEAEEMITYSEELRTSVDTYEELFTAICTIQNDSINTKAFSDAYYLLKAHKEASEVVTTKYKMIVNDTEKCETTSFDTVVAFISSIRGVDKWHLDIYEGKLHTSAGNSGINALPNFFEACTISRMGRLVKKE